MANRRHVLFGTLGALAATAVGAPARAAGTTTVLAEKWLGPRLVDLTVHSAANNRDLPVRLLVPPGWSRTAAATWPVLYLLHGGNDDYTSWTRETDIAALTANTGMLVVMPEAGRDANYVDWFNPAGGPNAGRWETFHLTEVWQVLRGGYRAGTTRGVAGISSGGTGAMTYAARNPGMFKFAASYSGPMNILDPVLKQILLKTATDNGDNPNAIWGDPTAQADNWRQHNPMDLPLAGLKGTSVYLSSGQTGLPGEFDPNDSWNPIQFGEAVIGSSNFMMNLRLFVAGVPTTLNLYSKGTHSWPYWQRELRASWPLLTRSLGL